MIRNRNLVFTFGLLFFLASTSVAQRMDIERISEIIQPGVQKEMPGWVRRRVPPIMGSGNVLIESWSSGNASIKLSVIPCASNEEAMKRFREFATLERDSENLTDVGDEGYAWGFRKSKFSFRRGNLIVYVSIDADDMIRPEKVAKQFAKVVVHALKDW